MLSAITNTESSMKNALVVSFTFGFFLAISTTSQAQFRNRRDGLPDAGQYGWLTNLEQGKAQAQKTGKPLMVVVRCVP